MAFIGTPLDTRNAFQSLVGKRFSGDGSTTAFTLDVAPGNVLDIEVFVGNAEYIIKENIVSGQKTITNPQTGAKKNITFREFYETKAAAGVPIKEIVEEWSKLPKPKKS